MTTKLQEVIDSLPINEISEERKEVLQPLIDYIQGKVSLGEDVNLNFICTHNSRRSQFAQLWAHTASHYYDIPVKSMSGGVEVTFFNERAVASIKRMGFRVFFAREQNPIYSVFDAEEGKSLKMFSKLFDDRKNDASKFAAVMTCDHADENCPFIPGTEARIPVRYEDPKAFDDLPEEADKYDERSRQIGAELFYTFSKIVR
ncbi:protein-tyrosine-phosphatase [Reichenbachiella versicolor]|uniref:protein-tyrosine-phosphatase n=1 Tax=Reichenbachiella versicolor TaxID=1821036 RepID=UPI000D6E5A84|nr:protein-tyrosine-phosphatase [Reichenbachiella versicolor]